MGVGDATPWCDVTGVKSRLQLPESKDATDLEPTAINIAAALTYPLKPRRNAEKIKIIPASDLYVSACVLIGNILGQCTQLCGGDTRRKTRTSTDVRQHIVWINFCARVVWVVLIYVNCVGCVKLCELQFTPKSDCVTYRWPLIILIMKTRRAAFSDVMLTLRPRWHLKETQSFQFDIPIPSHRHHHQPHTNLPKLQRLPPLPTPVPYQRPSHINVLLIRITLFLFWLFWMKYLPLSFFQKSCPCSL